jgi:hypothetical protein
MRILLLSCLALPGCFNKICSDKDKDEDGLDGCAEEEAGTDPTVADSDGDGLSDGEEVACVSDPNDASELCYACGWPHNDPGNLTSTGAEIGDVIANLQMPDQCGEMVDLWDFYGEYRIIFTTTAT